MRPSESPFPCHWWGIALVNAGLRDVRPDVGTYGRYSFEQLPAPPTLRGDFGWLTAAPAHEEHIGREQATKNARALERLRVSVARHGLRLPRAFTTYFENPALHQRVRSSTDCFLDLCSEPVPSPLGDGYLVRFLADSQGCLFWYLYLPPVGKGHAVLSSTAFFGTAEEQWQDDLEHESEISFVAESFELFMWRFWIENEIWFAGWQNTPLSDAALDYVEGYRVAGNTS
jgi:hypothetical protein